MFSSLCYKVNLLYGMDKRGSDGMEMGTFPNTSLVCSFI